MPKLLFDRFDDAALIVGSQELQILKCFRRELKPKHSPPEEHDDPVHQGAF
jgi:hypothetical protein